MALYVLFDDERIEHFYPLSSTRSIADFRLGIFTIREKWKKNLGQAVFVLTQDYLQAKYPLPQNNNQEVIYINSRYLPTPELVSAVQNLSTSKCVYDDKEAVFIAFKAESLFSDLSDLKQYLIALKGQKEAFKGNSDSFISNRWDIFQKNHVFIQNDLDLKRKEGIKWIKPSSSNQILGSQVFIEEGATVECSILNSNTGPIYIEKGAEVMEGSMVRGPFALCTGATLKMGSKIYGATTIGPHCKIGGELNNSVIFGYSNKAHDGFLGNSVIGEWCNLGADTNNSNLKNNYGEVSVWDYATNKYINTHEQFIGICMGDHAKAGINTMFNTGTVIGAFANVYGSDFPEKFIPDFSWGSLENWQEHDFDKAMDMASKVMQRRKLSLNPNDINIYKHIFERTRAYRK